MCPDKILISAYFDGELEGEEKERISGHLKECHDCSELLNAFQTQSNGIKDLGQACAVLTAKNGLENRIKDRILHDLHGRSSKFRDRRISLPIPVAVAAAALFVFLGIFSFNLAVKNSGQGLQPLTITEDASHKGQDGAMLSALDKTDDMMLLLQDSDSVATIEMEIPLDMKTVIHGESQLVRANTTGGGY